ncbi:MAG: hypothetical protein IE878_01055 [Epsilonproteobacteria bacterium]|nr:hypothetical protein [Campylobacterota bacterium]MBD3838961.1 hypothetical protein [Campylobacterota bacterium]
MNIAIILRYKNELLVLVSLLFLISAYLYKLTKTHQDSVERVELAKNIADFNRVVELQNSWKVQNMSQNVGILKSVVPTVKIQAVDIEGNKLKASYKMLNPNELNMVVDKIFNLPIQIQQFDVKESSKEQFMVDVRATW